MDQNLQNFAHLNYRCPQIKLGFIIFTKLSRSVKRYDNASAGKHDKASTSLRKLH